MTSHAGFGRRRDFFLASREVIEYIDERQDFVEELGCFEYSQKKSAQMMG